MSGETDVAAARVVWLDPRIAEQALWALINRASPDDRFIIRLPDEDRGLVHRWTDKDGVLNEEAFDVEVVEVTDTVHALVRRALKALGITSTRPDTDARDVGAEVVQVATDEGFHVVTDPGRRFLTKTYVDGVDCEHLVVREADKPAEPTSEEADEAEMEHWQPEAFEKHPSEVT